MMSSPPSSSDRPPFELLHPGIQRWIWDQGWDDLREIQARSIPAVLEGRADVIIAAATAGGKTEAAFLPILSAIAGQDGPGFKALYISPLKALINDQWRRLDGLCERLDIPVVKWHGDVSASVKQRAVRTPTGVVLITPESLEAILIRRANDLARLFGDLRYVVIDELHAFIGSERGVQLLSLLRRFELATGRRAPRVGLSATLGDMRAAAAHLRPEAPDNVVIIETRGGGQELRVQVRAYLPDPIDAVTAGPDAPPPEPAGVFDKIANQLFAKLRGSQNLVFAGSRQLVELYADRLRERCERLKLPNEFFPHHGNLSRELREEVEQRLREGALPTTVVCTTTLELGIDIGAVESVAQIGPPRSVAGLRQRLGRSGRREGKPAILRIHIPEKPLAEATHPFDWLRPDVVQSIAAVRLLVERWYEPPETRALHLSTLLHQTLALIAQRGGATAKDLYAALCGLGPFGAVDGALYAELLRAMGHPDRALIEQAPDGSLMLGTRGEKIVDHYGFYAVFKTDEEYRVASGGRVLGTVPVDKPLAPDSFIIFAGRRWKVLAVDPQAKLISVEPARGGSPPTFGGGDGAMTHDRLVTEMRAIYREETLPGFLDPQALDLLAQARQAYRDLSLDRTGMLAAGDRVLLIPWVGSKKLETLALALKLHGLSCLQFSLGLEVQDTDPETVLAALAAIAEGPRPDPLALAAVAGTKATFKFDEFLTEELLCADFAARWLEPDTAPRLARALTGVSDPTEAADAP